MEIEGILKYGWCNLTLAPFMPAFQCQFPQIHTVVCINNWCYQTELFVVEIVSLLQKSAQILWMG